MRKIPHRVIFLGILILAYLLARNVPHETEQLSLVLFWGFFVVNVCDIDMSTTLLQPFLNTSTEQKSKRFIAMFFVILAFIFLRNGFPSQSLQSLISTKPVMLLFLFIIYSFCFRIHWRQILLSTLWIIGLSGLYFVEHYTIEAEMLAITGFLLYAFAITRSVLEN